MYKITNNEKRPWVCRKVKNGIWEGLDGERKRRNVIKL